MSEEAPGASGSQTRSAWGPLLENLGLPLSFWLVFRVWGSKPAIAVAVMVAAVELWVLRAKGRRPPPIFLVASAFTLFFGGLDLILASPQLFKLSPAIQNAVLGFAFLASERLGLPLGAWFAQGFPERFRPRMERLPAGYLEKVIFVWSVYFLAKAAFFLYLAHQVDLAQLILLRSLVGGGSLILLLVGEVAFRKKVLRA